MSDNQGYCKSCEKLADEIERLHEELDLVGRGAATQIQERTNQYNTALIDNERLRQLLRDILNEEGFLGIPLDLRVREALKDEH